MVIWKEAIETNIVTQEMRVLSKQGVENELDVSKGCGIKENSH